MAYFSTDELEAAQKALRSTLRKNEAARQTLLAKQPPRTAQAAMLSRQLEVLSLALTFLDCALQSDAPKPDIYPSETLQAAAQAIHTWIGRIESAQQKFNVGTPQHTLAMRRVRAFQIVLALIGQENNAMAARPAMTTDELLFFNAMPPMLPLYEVLKEALERAYPNLKIKTSKTQISFCNRFIFATASLPWRNMKGWPRQYLLVSFGLPYEKAAPRIARAVQAAPNRWTHHVIVQTPQEIDAQLMEWIDEAYQFSLAK